MKKPLFHLIALGALLAVPLSNAHAGKPFREQLTDKLASCEYSLDVVMKKPETAVPPEAFQQAKGIVIVHQYRVGLILGGQAGTGVLVARNPQTGDWGPPVLLDPGGINFGLQAGAKEINSVFLLLSDEAVQRAYSGRFDIGADATAVAGPRNAEVENFDLFKADVWVYSSFGGLYAGASVKTGWITPYEKGNRVLYDTQLGAPEIALSTWFKVPADAQKLVDRIRGYAGGS